LLSNGSAVSAQIDYAEQGGASLLMPMSMAAEELPHISAQRQIDAFTMQLGGIPMGSGKPLVVPPKWYYEKR
jgi:hypothetical protein